MILGKDCAVVTVGLLIKIISPGNSRLLLGSPGSVVEDDLFTVTVVTDLMADTLVEGVLVTDAAV
jgi:hypothetical protein